MFKKNTALPGFPIGHFIQTADGAAKTTGTPTCKRLLDGVGGTLTNAAAYDATAGVWKIDLAAEDTNGDMVGLVFSLADCIPISYAVRTSTSLVSDVETDTADIQARLPAALVSGRIDASAGAMATDVLTAAALNADAVIEIADALLKRDMSAVTGESARSPLNALRALRNKVAVVDTTMTVYKEDDSTSAWTATVTGTTGADPITTVDPA